MIILKRITTLICFITLLSCFTFSCNNETEQTTGGEQPVVDTMETNTGKTAPITELPKPNEDDGVKHVDSTHSTKAIKPTDDGDADEATPKASIAYAYKNKMKKGSEELIQMNVQLDKPLEKVAAGLKNSLNEEKAIEMGSSDTSIVKSISIIGDKYFIVTIDYDTSAFDIKRSFGNEKQELKFNKPNKWAWRVIAKKETAKSEILIIVKSEDENGVVHESDFNRLPIEITVDTPLQKTLPAEPEKSFFPKYGWLLMAVAGILVLFFIFSVWRKRKQLKELNSRIYFSYAWHNEKDTIIDKLYLSLEKDGFKVVRDKVDLKYKGLISNFMKDIGKGNIIIIALSDKYLKSRFCMFELYEIYRNCGMSKEEFVKKLFPIREEDINLSDAAVIDHYVDYWKDEELKLEAIVKDKNQETTSEQFAQYEAIRRIESELGNLLYFLSDINALNVELLSNNDFAEIKQSLNNAIKNMGNP